MSSKRASTFFELDVRKSVPHSLQKPLLDDVISRNLWMKTLAPLQWLLIPMGILTLFPENSIKETKYLIIEKIWSYVMCGAIVGLYPSYEWIFSIDKNGSGYNPESEEWENVALLSTNIMLYVTNLYIYYFLRFQYISEKNDHFQQLCIDLYKTACNSNININRINNNNNNSKKDNNNNNNLEQLYHKSLHEKVKTCVYIVYGLMCLGILSWIVSSFVLFGKSSPWYIYVATPTIYALCIWFPMFVGIAVFAISMRMLELRYYLFSTRMMYSFGCKKYLANFQISVGNIFEAKLRCNCINILILKY